MRGNIEYHPSVRYDAAAVGKRIKGCRERLGLSVTDLAKIIEYDPSHLRKIESGYEGASNQLLITFSEVLQTTTDYLLKGKTGCNSQTRILMRNIFKSLYDYLENDQEDTG